MAAPPPSERAFLFDLDGVLVDTSAIVAAAWRRFATERGQQIVDADLGARIFGRRTADILVDVFGVARPEAESLAAAGLDDRSAEINAGTPLPEVPGAAAFVRRAHASAIPLALVSSASLANVQLALGRLDLADAFRVVVHAGSVARGKPAPDPYRAAVEGLGVDPSVAVVFEDSRHGIAAGRAIGARCVAVATTEEPGALAGADLVIDDFRGLDPLALLERLPVVARRRTYRGDT